MEAKKESETNEININTFDTALGKQQFYSTFKAIIEADKDDLPAELRNIKKKIDKKKDLTKTDLETIALYTFKRGTDSTPSQITGPNTHAWITVNKASLSSGADGTYGVPKKLEKWEKKVHLQEVAARATKIWTLGAGGSSGAGTDYEDSESFTISGGPPNPHLHHSASANPLDQVLEQDRTSNYSPDCIHYEELYHRKPLDEGIKLKLELETKQEIIKINQKIVSASLDGDTDRVNFLNEVLKGENHQACMNYGIELIKDGYSNLAIPFLIPAALTSNDPYAQLLLGDCYLKQAKLAKQNGNSELAKKFYGKAQNEYRYAGIYGIYKGSFLAGEIHRQGLVSGTPNLVKAKDQYKQAKTTAIQFPEQENTKWSEKAQKAINDLNLTSSSSSSPLIIDDDDLDDDDDDDDMLHLISSSSSSLQQDELHDDSKSKIPRLMSELKSAVDTNLPSKILNAKNNLFEALFEMDTEDLEKLATNPYAQVVLHHRNYYNAEEKGKKIEAKQQLINELSKSRDPLGTLKLIELVAERDAVIKQDALSILEEIHKILPEEFTLLGDAESDSPDLYQNCIGKFLKKEDKEYLSDIFARLNERGPITKEDIELLQKIKKQIMEISKIEGLIVYDLSARELLPGEIEAIQNTINTYENTDITIEETEFEILNRVGKQNDKKLLQKVFTKLEDPDTLITEQELTKANELLEKVSNDIQDEYACICREGTYQAIYEAVESIIETKVRVDLGVEPRIKTPLGNIGGRKPKIARRDINGTPLMGFLQQNKEKISKTEARLISAFYNSGNQNSKRLTKSERKRLKQLYKEKIAPLYRLIDEGLALAEGDEKKLKKFLSDTEIRNLEPLA